MARQILNPVSIRYASLEDERKAVELAASLDAAAGEFERNGPVTRERLVKILQELEVEWAQEDQQAATN